MTTFLLDDMQTYLAAAGLGLTFGTNLFASLLPDSPDSCVMLWEYGAEEPVDTMGAATLPIMEIERFQVVTRDPDYQAAKSTAHGIWKALNKIGNQTVNGTVYQRVKSLQSPFFSHRDTPRRIYLICNFRATKTPAP